MTQLQPTGAVFATRHAGLKFFATVLLLLSTYGLQSLWAQNDDPVALLVYYSNQDGLEVFNAEGFRYEHYFGMALLPGDRIVNQSSAAEVEVLPAGTILKIAPHTEFALESIQGRRQAPSTNLNLVRGRIRGVASTIAGNRLQIRAGTVVGGVRGTDFLFIYDPGERARILVRTGLVELTNTETGVSVPVAESQSADGLAEVVQVATVSPEELTQEFGELEFTQLDPEEVPRPEPQPLPEPQPDRTPVPEPIEAPEPEVQDAPGAALFERMANYVGFEFGAVTIEGATYSRVVIGPRIEVGRFRAALYLPFIYQEDLFDANEWYRPGGNNEWSFGNDYSWSNDTENAVEDLARDISLKIRYIEFGQQRDPVFLRAGSLSNITLGHGLLMNRYANDSDFPAVRRLGLNLGVDGTYGGFEAMTSDVVNAEISGVRLYMRPAAPLFRAALGVSAVADIYPGESLRSFNDPNLDLISDSNPVLLNVAADLDFPLLETRPVSLILYSEVGGLLPYLRDEYGDPANGGLDSGLQENVLFDWGNSELRNYGASAGVTGNLFALDYTAEYRYSHGLFQHGVYNAAYDRNRAVRTVQVFGYLLDSDNQIYDTVTMGIYGEAGLNIFQLFRLEAGYLWPWEIDDAGSYSQSDNDEALLRLAVLPGWMPGGLYGSFSYRRVGFIPTIQEREGYEDADLFDHNTLISGELVLPVAPAVSFAAGFTTTILRDEQGQMVYDSQDRPKLRSSVKLETRIGY